MFTDTDQNYRALSGYRHKLKRKDVVLFGRICRLLGRVCPPDPREGEETLTVHTYMRREYAALKKWPNGRPGVWEERDGVWYAIIKVADRISVSLSRNGVEIGAAISSYGSWIPSHTNPTYVSILGRQSMYLAIISAAWHLRETEGSIAWESEIARLLILLDPLECSFTFDDRADVLHWLPGNRPYEVLYWAELVFWGVKQWRAFREAWFFQKSGELPEGALREGLEVWMAREVSTYPGWKTWYLWLTHDNVGRADEAMFKVVNLWARQKVNLEEGMIPIVSG